jgi:hypothetical protein
MAQRKNNGFKDSESEVKSSLASINSSETTTAKSNAVNFNTPSSIRTNGNDVKNDNITQVNIDTMTSNKLSESEILPLSILNTEGDISSFAGNVPPSIPTLGKRFNLGRRNEISLGLGVSMVQIGIPQHRIVTLSYFRRITSLMAFGATVGYSSDSKKAYVSSFETQLNFTLIRRQYFSWNLTTGYGFRNWRLFENVNLRDGNGKGITLGTEGRFYFSKKYFTGLRVDFKETNYSNFGVQVQIGRLF